MSEEPRAGSFAALDTRIHRIEDRQDEQARVLSELNAEMRVLQAGQLATSGALQGVSAKLDHLLSQGTAAATMMADPEATPAGRLLLKEIVEAKSAAIIAQKSADSLALKVAAAGGALALVIFLVNLFAPAIRAAFGLP